MQWGGTEFLFLKDSYVNQDQIIIKNVKSEMIFWYTVHSYNTESWAGDECN